MTVTPAQVRRGAIVLVRLQNDKSRPAAIIRSDLLAELPYATILPLTTEARPDVDFRITVQPSEENGLRETSQIMVDWPQTVRSTNMGAGGAGPPRKGDPETPLVTVLIVLAGLIRSRRRALA